MNIKKIYLGTIATMVAVTPIVAVSCGDKKSNKITAEEQRKMDSIQNKELKDFRSKLPFADKVTIEKNGKIGVNIPTRVSSDLPVASSWWAKAINGKLPYDERTRSFISGLFGMKMPEIPKEIKGKLMKTIYLKKRFIEIMLLGDPISNNNPFKMLHESSLTSIVASGDNKHGILKMTFGITTKGATKEYKEITLYMLCLSNEKIIKRYGKIFKES